MNRTPTWNVDEGFGLLRWGDSEKTLRGLYSNVTMSKASETRHPLTGDVLREPASPIVHAAASTPEGIVLSAKAKLEADRLVELFVSVEHLPPGMTPPKAAAVVAKLMGVGPVTEKKEQTFEVGDVQVDLRLETKGFSFTLVRLL